MPLVDEFSYSNDTFGTVPETTVKCLICGSEYKTIGSHIAVHGYTTDRYRKEFNYAGSLWANTVRRKQSKNGKRRYRSDNKVRETFKKGRKKGVERVLKLSQTDEGREYLTNISRTTRDKVKEWWTPERRKERSKLQSKNKKKYWDSMRASKKIKKYLLSDDLLT